MWLRGRSQVAVDNRSNIKYRAELLGTDGDSAFAYSFRPRLIDVAPGSVAFAKVTVRPKSTVLARPFDYRTISGRTSTTHERRRSGS